ncbi:tyrosine-protein kinase [Pseudomonas sp. CFBP13508]|jgi:tyrosine-protein kinase Etk/Wzc|uniref:Polysaccharide biosynthesis tyrosine autokinase n=2 Tax=Pseudomonas atacamensis TaxID=2565368 RepID=A0AAQ2HZR2_9PSED|nr:MULTISPECIES: polysaccharide biosynthesis tyrosine autokinase [Pseudomonas]PYB96437.1 tyrosine-protein kinase [Pseudomonas koreensis]RRW61575.1 polysaccharide biosynthesis tyrosine autokinase [Pseudomonas fluorescens]MBV4471273.1 polysaccharide biosynthesis tyrosine autokinase [Pseudomonas siliginis]MCW0922509.1 polysaccharide biosynthesis tyrosine autokinase [Pseudomonas sp. RG1]QXH71392.1 polysaccharide biosynthesis tyrosine autokinase [Pseudomonas atacamensis]
MQLPSVIGTRDNDQDSIDLLGIFGSLIDQKWLIGALTGAFMVTGVAYAVLATPVYLANALVQVEPKKNDMLGFSDLNSMLGGQSPSVTEIGIIKSRAVIGKTVDDLRLDIDVTPNTFPLIGGFLSRRYRGDSETSVAPPRFGLNSYAWGGERLEFNRLQLPKDLLGKKLTLIAGEQQRFQLFDENDNLLAEGVAGEAFANDGVEGQIAHLSANPGTRFQVVRNPRIVTIQGYQDALDISEQGKESGIIRLALASSDAAEAVKILNKIASLYVEQNVRRTSAEAAQSLAFLQSQLPQVKRDLAKASDALNAYQTHGKTVNISLETQSVLGQSVALETRISELKMQQAELDRKFTKQHPAYRALMTQIGELTQQQKSLEGKVQDLPATQQELLNLTRDVEVASQIYTQLLNKSQELDIVRAGAVGNVRLIDTADVDLTNPIKPKKPLIVLIATLLGAFVGVALVLLRKSLSRGLEGPEGIEQLGLPVYASIPYSALQEEEDNKKGRARDGVDKPAYLLALRNPTDLSIESIRSLRTCLHFAGLDSTNNRIMISGPSPQVGKTFVSSNLAAVMALSGQRVVLIDADMRKGHLHKTLNTPISNGLSDLLVKRCTLEQAINKVEVDNLHFISRGQVPPNPSELLMHANFRELLAELSERYDLVIIDTPPLLAVTDAAIVGREAGISLIVTRFGVNPAKEIELTIRRFAQNGIELKGAVFNGVEKRAASYYGGTGYYNYEYASDKS